jgi:hypothetical protein
MTSPGGESPTGKGMPGRRVHAQREIAPEVQEDANLRQKRFDRFAEFASLFDALPLLL